MRLAWRQGPHETAYLRFIIRVIPVSRRCIFLCLSPSLRALKKKKNICSVFPVDSPAYI